MLDFKQHTSTHSISRESNDTITCLRTSGKPHSTFKSGWKWKGREHLTIITVCLVGPVKVSDAAVGDTVSNPWHRPLFTRQGQQRRKSEQQKADHRMTCRLVSRAQPKDQQAASGSPWNVLDCQISGHTPQQMELKLHFRKTSEASEAYLSPRRTIVNNMKGLGLYPILKAMMNLIYHGISCITLKVY